MISAIFSFFPPPKTPNQRKFPRYCVDSLRVWIQKPGLLGMFDDHVELSPIDFNQTGMAFRHDYLLIPGQSIMLDLKKGDHKLTGIMAVVRYTSQHRDHYRSGVEFSFDVNDYMSSTEVRQTLNEIESLLTGTEILADV